MNLELYYRILKHDPDGRLVKDTGLMPSGSYVIQFLEMIGALFDGIRGTFTDTNGAESTMIYELENIDESGQVRAPALDDKFGLVVGTNAGVSAEDNEDYALDSKIPHGDVGAVGTMNYRDVTFVAPRVVGPNVDFDVFRAFINENDATITVKEIGIITRMDYGVDKFHLILRDVVADEAVEAGYTLTVGYTLRSTA